MDQQTLSTYNTAAATYCNDWLSQPTPKEIHEIVEKYFKKGGTCADVGSGSGRDTDWLSKQGFHCIGFDASEGLLQEARKRFPQGDFRQGSLPDLLEVSDQFDNVLCETVLMHLLPSEHNTALKNLLRITKSGGVLSLSWRLPVEEGKDREKDGRLYAPVNGPGLKAYAEMLSSQVLHEGRIKSPSSGKTIEQLVLRKI
jgi:ubiquinone/menaquinone biosynthesis C-methylase UbiE